MRGEDLVPSHIAYRSSDGAARRGVRQWWVVAWEAWRGTLGPEKTSCTRQWKRRATIPLRHDLEDFENAESFFGKLNG